MTELTFSHPGLVLIVGALVAAVAARHAARGAAALLVPLAALRCWCWQLPDGAGLAAALPRSTTLTPLAVDKLSRLFATDLRADGLRRRAVRAEPEEAASSCRPRCVYAGSAIGVALAGDLITLFVFWELMAIGSTLVIWSAGDAAA